MSDDVPTGAPSNGVADGAADELVDGAVDGEAVDVVAEAVAAKQALRREMRALRTALTDRPERSADIVDRLLARADVAAARRVMAYASLPSEPDTADLLERCRAAGQETAVPEDEVDPAWPDVIIVPGLAFTSDGLRCGQGGGWYDRFLPGVRDDCVLIGVCFAPQLVDELPTEAHDMVMHAVVTD